MLIKLIGKSNRMKVVWQWLFKLEDRSIESMIPVTVAHPAFVRLGPVVLVSAAEPQHDGIGPNNARFALANNVKGRQGKLP